MTQPSRNSYEFDEAKPTLRPGVYGEFLNHYSVSQHCKAAVKTLSPLQIFDRPASFNGMRRFRQLLLPAML